MTHLDDFLRGYATAILWANAYTYDDAGELVPDEAAHYAYVTPGEWWTTIGLDLTGAISFYNNESSWLWRTGERDFGQHGHDFALTRNGHGAGFWDRGYPQDVADHLTTAAHAYGEHSMLTDTGPTVTNL